VGDRIASWIAVSLATAVLAVSWWYSQSLRQEAALQGAHVGGIDSRAEAIVLTGFDEAGRARFRLFAAGMEHDGGSDDLALERPRLVSMRADQPRVEVTAEHARADNNAETVDLQGDVLLVREAVAARPALRLATATLHVVPDEDRFSTGDEVRIEEGRSSIVARGMVYDNIARHLDLQSAVRVHLSAGRP